MFKTNLEEFASKHKQEIRKNPEFRVQFQDMCATIGVDPLACKELSVGVCSPRIPRGQKLPSCYHCWYRGIWRGLQGDGVLSSSLMGKKERLECRLRSQCSLDLQWNFLWLFFPFITKYLVLMKRMCDHAINKGEKRKGEIRSLLSPIFSEIKYC